MNNNATNPSYTVKDAKIHNDPVRACLLSFIPKRNAERIDISDVWKHMSRFLIENKRIDIVHDFAREKSSANEVYQDKTPNRVDANKLIQKMRDLECDVLIIPTFATLAETPEICSDIMMELHEAHIRIVSPYDAFDSKIICQQVDKETADLFKEFKNALFRILDKCVVNNVDEFISYVDKTRSKHKNPPFCIAFGNKSLLIPFSDDICTEIFDFLDLLDEEYLRPELYADDEYDDEDDDDDEAPPMCVPYDEPLVERDFEG